MSPQSKTCDDPEVMASSLKMKSYNKNAILVVRGESSYLKRLKKVRILCRVGVEDGRTIRAMRRNDPKPDNVVHTQSMLISQEGITATQEKSRDSDRRIRTNYTQIRMILLEKIVDIIPGESRPNVESICVLIICDFRKFVQGNEVPVGRINLRN